MIFRVLAAEDNVWFQPCTGEQRGERAGCTVIEKDDALGLTR